MSILTSGWCIHTTPSNLWRQSENHSSSVEVLHSAPTDMDSIGLETTTRTLPSLRTQFSVTLCLECGECKWSEAIFVVSVETQQLRCVRDGSSLARFILLPGITTSSIRLISSLMLWVLSCLSPAKRTWNSDIPSWNSTSENSLLAKE